MRARHRLLFAVMLSPALLASKCGKKVVDEEETKKTDINAPEVTLQVASIDPSYGRADTTFAAEVLGNGFERGAVVSLGGMEVDTRFRDDGTLSLTVPAMTAGSYDVAVVNPDGTRANLRKGLTLTAESNDSSGRCQAVTIAFGHDSSVLDASVRGSIEAAATCLRDSTDFVRVEGHCDDQGTTDYNLALGQRRADAVARYLTGLGVAPSRVQAVSYGEERPAAAGTSSDARAKNRRAEIIPGGGR